MWNLQHFETCSFYYGVCRIHPFSQPTSPTVAPHGPARLPIWLYYILDFRQRSLVVLPSPRPQHSGSSAPAKIRALHTYTLHNHISIAAWYEDVECRGSASDYQGSSPGFKSGISLIPWCTAYFTLFISVWTQCTVKRGRTILWSNWFLKSFLYQPGEGSGGCCGARCCGAALQTELNISTKTFSCN